MSDDDALFDYTGPQTVVRFEFGDFAATVTMRQNLSPDIVDDMLLKGRRQFVAAARQLNMVEIVDSDALGSE